MIFKKKKKYIYIYISQSECVKLLAGGFNLFANKICHLLQASFDEHQKLVVKKQKNPLPPFLEAISNLDVVALLCSVVAK